NGRDAYLERAVDLPVEDFVSVHPQWPLLAAQLPRDGQPHRAIEGKRLFGSELVARLLADDPAFLDGEVEPVCLPARLLLGLSALLGDRAAGQNLRAPGLRLAFDFERGGVRQLALLHWLVEEQREGLLRRNPAIAPLRRDVLQLEARSAELEGVILLELAAVQRLEPLEHPHPETGGVRHRIFRDQLDGRR